MKFIESPKNPAVKQWKRLLNKKDRDKSGKFIVEGFHLVEEALLERDLVSEVIVQEDTELPAGFPLQDVELIYVTREVMVSISDTETPQGIAAVCSQRKYEWNPEWKQFLLIDAVQDPGNIGTMIRTADAAGLDAVILGEGSADPYSPKVIRSTQGSLFHLPVLKGSLGEYIPKLSESGVSVFGTSLEGGVSYETLQKQMAFALLVGNEGKGVSGEWLALTKQNLYIPLFGRSESLNVAVAAGILLYHLKMG
ncbi:TrmH family RNA methyltransferase [Peribacillus kribbensis]|uniref:TrmH family RNA methyltransferase n=1 Tax=Peribacillus kribbensis TaxID=356658 RepID=UPI00047E56EE|nr:RNA methyltransferase [Peribacillus kribbensis]